jgi:hypothetical protein
MMQDHVNRLLSHMAAIAVERNLAKRDASLREHDETMYRDMQSMRGMRWRDHANASAHAAANQCFGKRGQDPKRGGTRRNHRVLVQIRSRVALST